ncbi:unnamed protein product [Dibothriocephalus latus]|uniref:Uncharacterized protein n=1 Tax=Dibothriocephalus latus TaxID=60516 RepID=A0A3P6PHF2_DIBLA|nr:unnamed protein product [Dibothriocephalus latus]
MGPAGCRCHWRPPEPQVPLVGLFGCVDEFNLAGHNFDVGASKRPNCPQCFILDSAAAHVRPQMASFLTSGRRRPISMKFQPLNNAKLRWRLSFEVLYNPGEVSEASLFVLVFRSPLDDNEVRLWIHLKRRKVKVLAFMCHDLRVTFKFAFCYSPQLYVMETPIHLRRTIS